MSRGHSLLKLNNDKKNQYVKNKRDANVSTLTVALCLCKIFSLAALLKILYVKMMFHNKCKNYKNKSYYLLGIKYYSTTTYFQEKELLKLIQDDRNAVLNQLIRLNKSHRPQIEKELSALYVLAYTDYYKKLAHGECNRLTLADYNDAFNQALVSFISSQHLVFFI